MISYNRESNTLRLASITEQNGPTYLNNISYNPAGQAWQFYLGNGIIEGFGYDSNRLQMTTQLATTPGGAPGNLMTLTLGYTAQAGQLGTGTTAGNAGQLMSVSGTINGQTESAAYTYDLERRLVTSSQASNGASAQRRLAYDRWGNRTGEWDSVSGGNQIQSVTLQQSGGAPTNRIASVTSTGTVNYTYDSAGNVTNDGAHTYTYDAENRLVTVDGGSTARYYYDFSGRRVMKVSGGVTTHYVWEGGRVLAEHNGSTGSVLVDYIYGGGALIAKVASGVTSYFITDRLSIRMALDSSGNVIGRQAHLPFGEDFAESGQQEKHHFTNYEADAESGMDYAINRHYSQATGRFLSPDPDRGGGYLIDSQVSNRYGYARNDSINSYDPLGLDVCFIVPVGEGYSVTCLDQYHRGTPGLEQGNDTEGGNSPYEQCAIQLGEELIQNGFGHKENNGSQTISLVGVVQFAQAEGVATATGVPMDLLLSTWFEETRMGGAGTANNLSGPAYGPMQLTVSTANTYRGDFTLQQVVGNTSSGTFTGDVIANLTVGATFLNDLLSKTGGNEALAGTAYLGPNAVIGKSPDQLKGAYKTRYKQYERLLNAFYSFNACVQKAKKDAGGS